MNNEYVLINYDIMRNAIMLMYAVQHNVYMIPPESALF